MHSDACVPSGFQQMNENHFKVTNMVAARCACAWHMHAHHMSSAQLTPAPSALRSVRCSWAKS